MTVDDFVSTLKDDWTGRRYGFDPNGGSDLLMVLSDDGENVVYRIIYSAGEHKQSKVKHKVPKKNLKIFLEEGHYVRIK